MIDNSWCTKQYTINPSTKSAESYTLGATTYTFLFPDFTLTESCSDKAWDYVAERVVSGTPSTLPSWITFTEAIPSFSVQTSTQSDVGTHIIKVTGTLNNG